MPFQLYPLGECLVALVAGKRLLTSVGPYMFLQMRPLVECHVTLVAGKWLLSCVGPLVPCQIELLGECLAALGAGKSHLDLWCTSAFVQTFHC